jgi:hypothetical protein
MNNPNAAPGDGRGETRIAKQKESNPHDDGWPEELTLLLKRLHGQGLSATEVAKRLNETRLFPHILSRSAVMGKIHRLRKKSELALLPALMPPEVACLPDSPAAREQKIALYREKVGVPASNSFQPITSQEIFEGYRRDLNKAWCRPFWRLADSLEREIAAYDRDPRTPWDVERKKIVARVLAITVRTADDTIPEPVRRAAVRAIDAIDAGQQRGQIVRPALAGALAAEVPNPEPEAQQLHIHSWRRQFLESREISTRPAP